MSNILLKYRRLPENVRMIITAILGVIIGYVTYEIIYHFNPLNPKASSSWFVAFIIGVTRQHALHRWLTFSHKTPYWRSLFRAYIMYSGSLFIGTGVNWLLTEIFFLNHRIAWGCCLIITASISFFLLKNYVFNFNRELND